MPKPVCVKLSQPGGVLGVWRVPRGQTPSQGSRVMFRPFRIEIIAATWILALTGGLGVFLAQLARVAVRG